MARIFGLFLLLTLGQSSFATHNLAGDITYRHISGLTYEFTITIFSDGNSPAISREEIEIDWGDNSGVDSLKIVEQTQVGDPIDKTFKRVWRGTHTFSGGAFTYTIRVIDPNRNANVANMPGSVNIPFTIESQLTISPFLGVFNNSVQLRNDPLDDACVGARYIYNPGAFDPDGDSIAYRRAESKGAAGLTPPGYTYPAASNSITVDPITGDLVWDHPTEIGLHTIAIKIFEYRNGNIIGTVLRDIQITVVGGCDNNPPMIFADQLVCVEAGSTLSTNIIGSDSDPLDDEITLTATGEVLEAPISTRTNFNSGQISNPTNASFVWNTICNDVRIQPYKLSIKAEDNAQDRGSTVNLVNFRTINIRVISPAVENVLTTPIGNSMNLDWSNIDCPNALGYYVYRKLDPSNFMPSECIPGVPDGIGYSKIGTINDINTTSFNDDNDGDGLVPGQVYCYLITKFFADGDESYASIEVCDNIEKVVPVMTNVSITSTDESNGSVQLGWSPPTVFDMVGFPPPYEYKIYDLTQQSGPVQIGSTNSIVDTNITDLNLNTKDIERSYRVDLYSHGNGETLVGKSSKANSIFLSINSTDKLLHLNWTANVPWKNNSYTIFRKVPSATTFDSIGVTNDLFYNDSNLRNGVEYCYYIRSTGSYNLISVKNPLINFSQEACASPIDNILPCSPTFEIESSCDDNELKISWNNLNNSCANDIAGYNIYRSIDQSTELVLIETKNSPDDTTYTPSTDSIVAGCYSISAIDSTGNESALPERLCVEYCPVYELPNVFTPNGDGKNDLFVPISPFKYVDSINIVIYNRWGELVFEGNDPAIKWNGTHSNVLIEGLADALSKPDKMVSSGIYYYICKVFELSLEPKEARILRGSITIIDPQPLKGKN